MPPTASELETVPIPRKVSEEEKGEGKKRFVDDATVDKERMVYSLVRDVVEGAQVKNDQEASQCDGLLRRWKVDRRRAIWWTSSERS